jgi:putative hydrolase of HD superfamily
LEEEQAKGLNMALVLAFALVHDLPEALTGDVPTFLPLTERQQREKDENEAAARRTIKARLGGSFWIIYELMELYERQDTPEARFVKILDKAMPKLVRALSGKGPQVSLEVLQALHQKQHAKLAKVAGQGSGGPQLALEFLNEASKHCEETWNKPYP